MLYWMSVYYNALIESLDSQYFKVIVHLHRREISLIVWDFSLNIANYSYNNCRSNSLQYREITESPGNPPSVVVK